MIAAWMVYALVVSGLLAGAALALDRLLRPYGASLRWIWAGALLLGAAWPVLAPLAIFSPGAAAGGSGSAGAPLVALEALTVTVGSASVLHRLDPFLVGLWAALSVALLALGARALLRLGRLRGRWSPGRIRDTPVLLADETGPAVVGLLDGRIVLPSWLLKDGEEDRLELAILHEREHLQARDPALVAVAFLVLVALPWNPVLWWIVHRLREAVEVDCDRRVLAHRPGRLRAYAETLLHVRGRGRSLPASPAALAEPRSFLERRIRTMTTAPPKRVASRTLVLGAAALLALSGACLAPEPGARESEGNPVEVEEAAREADVLTAAEISDEPVFTPFTHKPDIKNREELARALEEEYPPLLREAGIGGRVLIWFLIDRNGDVRELQIRESSGHEALDRAALRVARVFDFTPALNEEERVPVWIALPITFRIE